MYKRQVFELNSNILSQRETKVFFGHKNFIVYSDCSILGGKEMYLLYFIDNTEYRTLQKKYNDSRAIVSIILIDNYEELFQNARDNERTSAMAMICLLYTSSKYSSYVQISNL